MPELTIEQKKAAVEIWRKDPEVYFRKILKSKFIHDGQRKIFQGLVKHKKVIVGSGHGQGKDYAGGGLPLWFLSCFAPATVIMTAPTDRQVQDIMWMELTRHYKNAGGQEVMGGDLITKKFTVKEDQFCTAFTTKETKGQTGKFQGRHNHYMLIIVSEAQAVDDNIFEQIEGVATNDNCYVLLLGNPLRNTGYYARTLKNPIGWHKITLSCLDSINYKKKKQIIPGVSSYEWVEMMRKKYGEKSPIWFGRVLGVPPDGVINSVISQEVADKCINREVIYPYYTKRRCLTLDPASTGLDMAQFYVLEEGKIIHGEQYPYCLAPELLTRSVVLVNKYKCHVFAIDAIGEGGPLRDFARIAFREQGVKVYEYKASFKDYPAKTDDYLNLNAQSGFYLRDQMMAGYVSIPDDAELTQEITEQLCFINGAGQWQLEDKDDLKERIKRSPNKLEALKIGIWALKELGDITNKSALRANKRSGSIDPWARKTQFENLNFGDGGL